MKNWAVAQSTTPVRAMASVPRSFARPLPASFLMGLGVPGLLAILSSMPPPWTMKPGMTRWKMVPS